MTLRKLLSAENHGRASVQGAKNLLGKLAVDNPSIAFSILENNLSLLGEGDSSLLGSAVGLVDELGRVDPDRMAQLLQNRTV